MKLRDYQHDIAERVKHEWRNGHKNVCMVLPTGAGKTRVKSHLIRDTGLPSMCIAHRQELVLQISESLASFGIYHRIIAPNAVVGFCAERHMKSLGQSFIDAQAPAMLAGVQTLLRRVDRHRAALSRVRLWDVDECHHALPDNQWGRAIGLFPNAIGLGVTATPLRCDRRALDGVFDSLVVGAGMRDLIGRGYLTDYRIFCPPMSIRREDVRVSKSTGEFVKADLINRSHESRIVGDVVSTYKRIAGGKRGLTFTVDVRTAQETADAYNAAGVPAAMVHAGTPDRDRTDMLDRLGRGELLQLCNVDLFGEGMDCPAIEVVSMARPTQSYGLYVQQFGRMMRPLDGKTHGILIDHVGNVVAHGLPDAPRVWSLEGREKQETDAGAIQLRVCEACMQPYPSIRVNCPHCGHVWTPRDRGTPEQVDGDLEELDPAVLARMRGDVISIVGDPAIPLGAGPAIVGRRVRDHTEMIAEQVRLREQIAFWSGAQRFGLGLSDREIHKLYYLTFGTTIPESMALRRADAVKLATIIEGTLT